ncbi:MAG: hemolysin family protein [Bacteroidota bacterium]
MGLLLFYAAISIGFSFLCSILEAVLLSITPAYISSLPEKGALTKTIKAFKEDIDRPLSAILTLNTIAHTVGAILVGVQAANVFGDTGIKLGPINIHGEGLIAAIMTLAILILSEIIPKTLGANYWKQLTPFTVRSLRVMILVLSPLVWISQLITKNFKKDKKASVLSRSDFQALAQAGAQSGTLQMSESRAIRNLLRLDQIKVRSIMTPRTVMKSGQEGETLKEFYDNHKPFRYSRIPIFNTDKEHVKGVLLKDELLKALYENQENAKVEDFLRTPLFISDQASLGNLQEILMKGKNHMAIVTDDFGAVVGLVTMEDLFETILGLEIIDETDDVADLQILAREIWEKRQQDLP